MLSCQGAGGPFLPTGCACDDDDGLGSAAAATTLEVGWNNLAQFDLSPSTKLTVTFISSFLPSPLLLIGICPSNHIQPNWYDMVLLSTRAEVPLQSMNLCRWRRSGKQEFPKETLTSFLHACTHLSLFCDDKAHHRTWRYNNVTKDHADGEVRRLGLQLGASVRPLSWGPGSEEADYFFRRL